MFLNIAESFFSVFLIFEINIDVVVTVMHHVETTKNNIAPPEFVKTLLIASWNLFVQSLFTPMSDTRVSSLAALKEERKILCNEEEQSDTRKDAPNKRNNLVL